MNKLMQRQGKYSSSLTLLIVIGGVALAEVIAMIIVSYFKDLPYALTIVLDTLIMILIIIPVLYVFSLRPLLMQIQQRQQSEQILQARLRLMHYANTNPLSALMEFSLNEVEILTGNQIGFFHFLDADQVTIRLQAWSTNTLKNMCEAEGKGSHYDLDKAGVWADAVRQRIPIIHNDYATLADRKGLPEGHAQILRELVVPILREDKVVAILGVGNKAQDYSSTDVEVVSTFADFAWDIIEHKRIENDIRLSEEKFHTLVDWTYDWEMWIDTQGYIGYISPACERITGYTPQEFIADPKLLMRISHPEERQMMEDHLVVIHEALGDPITLEYRILARDGSEHWIEHICRPLFGANGQHLGRRISNRDITRRKRAEISIQESEEKYRSLVIATTQIIWQTNAEGEVIEDIPMWREYTGQSEEEIRGRGWIEALHPDDKGPTAEIWTRAVKSNSLYDTEYRIRCHTGEYGYFAVRGVPIEDQDGSISGWIGTCTDITEKKRYENQLIQAEKHAVIGRMVGSVTHEINNPLQTINNCLYLIRQDTGPESPANEALEMALSETKRLSNLVGQLRQLYRPQTTQTMHPHELLEIIKEVHTLITPHLNNANVSWMHSTGLESCYVNCVRDHIIEVMLNLCMNAIEAMGLSGGILSVGTVFSDDKEQVGVILSDTGPGISAEVLSHIFEPFVTTKGYGMGLGLSISYNIIQKHGGEITVDSRPNQGTSFTVWLPIHPEMIDRGE